MSYEKYYQGGWKSGETGGTPITPEALNHMENGIETANKNLLPDPQEADNATFLRNDNTWQTVTPANIGAVPTSRTVNGKALSANISLSASDVNALPTSGGTLTGNLTITAGKKIQLSNASGHTSAGIGVDSSTGDVYISNTNNNWFRIKGDKTMTIGGNKVYTALDKPTPADIGALSSANAKVLWKNASSTSSFALQTVSVPLTGINCVAVLMKQTELNSNVGITTGIFHRNTLSDVLLFGTRYDSTPYVSQRRVQVKWGNNQVYFGDGLQNNGSNNARMIPVAVIGLY